MQVQTKTGATAVAWPIKHIALAFDGSDEARRATTFTAQLAKAAGAEVTVLHFRELANNRFGGPEAIETTDELVSMMRDAVKELSEAGVTVSADVENSTPVGEARPIADLAHQVGADLIVAGTRGFSTGRALIQGSVSHDLIHATRLPILIVH